MSLAWMTGSRLDRLTRSWSQPGSVTDPRDPLTGTSEREKEKHERKGALGKVVGAFIDVTQCDSAQTDSLY